MSEEHEHPDAHGPHEPHEEVGSVAEEAAKLFGALGDWAQDQGDGVGPGFSDLAAQAAAAARGVQDHLATGAPECTWCPVCRTVHAVRRTSPEVRAHLAAAASSLLQAAAEAMATAVPDDRPGPRGGAGMERIDLDPDDGDDEWPEDEG